MATKFIAVAIKHLIEHGADPLAIQRFVDEIAVTGGGEVPATDARSANALRCARYRERTKGVEKHVATRVDTCHDTTGSPYDIKTLPPPSDNTASKKAKKGNRLPFGWKPSLEAIEYAKGLGFSATEIEAAAEDMRLWAACASGQVAIKCDWESAFKGWMRREKSRKPTARQGYGKVIQGSFRPKVVAPEPDRPKISEEERQANLLKLRNALKQSLDIERPCDTEGP